MARLAIAALCAVAIAGKIVRADVLVVGEAATEFDVAVDRAARPIKLANLRGRWLVIATGASWCKPCSQELPELDALAAQYRGRATFIALDVDDTAADGIAFHTALGLANMLRVYLPSASRMADRYGEALPVTLVIDPKGVVAFAIYGYDKTTSLPKLRRALDQRLPAPAVKDTPKPPDPAKPPDTVKPVVPQPRVTVVPTLILPEPPRTSLWAPGWRVLF